MQDKDFETKKSLFEKIDSISDSIINLYELDNKSENSVVKDSFTTEKNQSQINDIPTEEFDKVSDDYDRDLEETKPQTQNEINAEFKQNFKTSSDVAKDNLDEALPQNDLDNQTEQPDKKIDISNIPESAIVTIEDLEKLKEIIKNNGEDINDQQDIKYETSPHNETPNIPVFLNSNDNFTSSSLEMKNKEDKFEVSKNDLKENVDSDKSNFIKQPANWNDRLKEEKDKKKSEEPKPIYCASCNKKMNLDGTHIHESTNKNNDGDSSLLNGDVLGKNLKNTKQLKNNKILIIFLSVVLFLIVILGYNLLFSEKQQDFTKSEYLKKLKDAKNGNPVVDDIYDPSLSKSLYGIKNKEQNKLDSKGNPIGTVYDKDGNPILLDKNGEMMFFDKDGNRIFLKKDANGNWIAVDANGNPVPLELDENGNPIVYDINGKKLNVEFDENGNPIVYDENNVKTKSDLKDDLKVIYDKDGNRIFLKKDANGNWIAVDANGNPVPLELDENGNPIVYDENGNRILVDKNGNPILDENGNTIPLKLKEDLSNNDINNLNSSNSKNTSKSKEDEILEQIAFEQAAKESNLGSNGGEDFKSTYAKDGYIAALTGDTRVNFSLDDSSKDKDGNDQKSKYAPPDYSYLKGQNGNINPAELYKHLNGQQGYKENSEQESLDYLKTKENPKYSAQSIQRPISPFEIKVGTVIPSILISNINSDLPTDILAQVSENVRDTKTGNYILIPVGSKLIGNYKANVSNGQTRLLVKWYRLQYPNGAVINLENMAGIDTGGFAGFSDQIDNHMYKKLSSAVLLSGLTFLSSDDKKDDNAKNKETKIDYEGKIQKSLGEKLGQMTSKMLEKDLEIKPSINIRAGYNFNVFVNKDLILEPYED